MAIVESARSVDPDEVCHSNPPDQNMECLSLGFKYKAWTNLLYAPVTIVKGH